MLCRLIPVLLLITFITAPAMGADRITPLDKARTHIIRGEFELAQKQIELQKKETPEDPGVFAMFAQLEEKKENLKKAADYLEQAHKLDPTNTTYTRQLADVRFTLNDNDKALELYRQLLASNPSDEKILLKIARIHWRDGEYKQGLSAARAAAARKASDPDVHLMIGDIEYALNQPEKAAKSYQEALNLGGGDKALLYKLADIYEDDNKLDLAIAANKQILKKHPDQLTPYKNLSRLYRMKGDTYHSVEAWLSYISNGGPGSFMVGALLGFGFFFLVFSKTFRFINSLLLLPLVLLAGGLGQIKLLVFLAYISRTYATDHLAFLCNFEITMLDPKNARARRNLGHFYEKQGNTSLALQNFETAVELDPDMGDAWYSLGSIHLEQKDYKKAEISLRKALTAGDDSFMTWYHLSLAFFKQEIYQEAMDASREALEQSSQFTPPLDIFVESCESLGQIDNCKDFLEKLHRENPANIKILLELGNLYLSTGNARESLRFFEESIELSPDSFEVWYNFGVAQREADLLENALNSIRRALELSPGASWIHTSCGLTRIMVGKPEHAKENLNKALELDPGSAYSHFLLGKLLQTKDPANSTKHLKSSLEGFVTEVEKLTKPWQKANEYECIGIVHQLRGDKISARDAFAQAIKYAGITPSQIWIFSEDQMKLTPGETFVKECRDKISNIEPEASVELSTDNQVS